MGLKIVVMDPITVLKTIDYVMLKKRQMTNKLYGANGGWAAIRSFQVVGVPAFVNSLA